MLLDFIQRLVLGALFMPRAHLERGIAVDGSYAINCLDHSATPPLLAWQRLRLAVLPETAQANRSNLQRGKKPSQRHGHENQTRVPILFTITTDINNDK
ncbi:TPA: hypothetical protein QDZ42_003462 [Stenotrophomonas maltophilia]|nr:hypothetical protein [Stenotrophomonas maltophilia]HDS1044783.1 hypothetical protein [Stenotrophomonas maltophilia]